MPPPVKNPVTDEERQTFLHLAVDLKLGRNAIARNMDRSGATITTMAKEAGVSFDRSMTQDATRARKIDCEARRSQLEELYLIDAEVFRERCYEPTEYRMYAGRDGLEKWTESTPNAGDTQKLNAASRQSTETSMKLSLHSTDLQNLPAVDQWLEAMVEGGDDGEGEPTDGEGA